MRHRRLALAAGLLASIALLPGAAPPAQRVPALVFVARAPLSGDTAGQVPGVGPGGRLAAAGGRLVRRDPDGKVRVLVAPPAMFDVSDPSVSWDAKRIVFAGLAARDSAWRLYVVNADGTQLRALTHSDRALDLSPLGADAPRFARYDDFDPCWLPDGRIVFASTRYPQMAADGGAASNLFTVNADGTALTRLTSERHGADEPSIDPASGRIVYARWWTNRWLPSERDANGLTLDRARAVPEDTVNLWHAISLLPDGEGGKLAGGDPRGRVSVAAYQPVMLADGSLVGVVSENLALTPRPGRLGVRVFPGGFSAPRAIAGLGAVSGPGAAAATASACSPAALPGGGLLISLDANGTGDYVLATVSPDFKRITPLASLPGTLALDAVPLVARRAPPVAAVPRREALPDLPASRIAQISDAPRSFRFDCLNVFDSGALDRAFPEAPPMQQGVRIRFFAALARPASAGGDTAILFAEHPVRPNGAVHVDAMPGDTPMFEQLVDAHGHVLRSAMGPAHVPGFNFGALGSGTKCVGCHSGHSALVVPASAGQAEWINAAPSADVTASSASEDGPARAAVDRRIRGIPGDSTGRTAWIARSGVGESLQLRWRWPIEVAAVVLYPSPRDMASGTDLEILECELVFSRGGREVERTVLHETWKPTGSRVECGNRVIDGLEIRPLRTRGRVLHREAVAIAEIETIARLSAD